jgi:hypothetical protein
MVMGTHAWPLRQLLSLCHCISLDLRYFLVQVPGPVSDSQGETSEYSSKAGSEYNLARGRKNAVFDFDGASVCW